MITKYKNISAQRVKQLFKYEEDTGYLIGIGGSSTYLSGRKAGTIDANGYVVVTIDRVKYKVHRLIYLLKEGHLPSPEYEIDHIDGNRSNNMWSNLRVVTSSENKHNSKLSSANKTGIKGVSKYKGSYIARVRLHGIEHTAGRFDTLEEASIAVKNLRKTLHGEFANHGEINANC